MIEIYEYQELLCKKERLEAEIANLGSESDLLTIRRNFQREKKHLDAIKDDIKSLNAQKVQEGKEIEAIKEQGEDIEKQLYSGDITNPRELETLQDRDKEIQNRVSAAQSHQEETTNAIAAAAKKGEKSTTVLRKLKGDFDLSQQELKDAHAKLDEQVQECDKALTKLAKKIKKKPLTEFLANRDTNGGRLYALLKPGGSCSVCHRTLTKATLNRLDNGKEAKCDHCGRLLLIDED